MENTAAEEMYDFTKNRREKINLELSKIRSLYGREDVVYRFNAYKKAKDKDDIARKKGRSGYSGLPSARIELESACKSVGIEKTPDELIKDDSVIKTIHTRSEIISDQFLPILYKEYKNTPMTSDYMNRIIHRLTKSDTYIKKDDENRTIILKKFVMGGGKGFKTLNTGEIIEWAEEKMNASEKEQYDLQSDSQKKLELAVSRIDNSIFDRSLTQALKQTKCLIENFDKYVLMSKEGKIVDSNSNETIIISDIILKEITTIKLKNLMCKLRFEFTNVSVIENIKLLYNIFNNDYPANTVVEFIDFVAALNVDFKKQLHSLCYLNQSVYDDVAFKRIVYSKWLIAVTYKQERNFGYANELCEDLIDCINDENQIFEVPYTDSLLLPQRELIVINKEEIMSDFLLIHMDDISMNPKELFYTQRRLLELYILNNDFEKAKGILPELLSSFDRCKSFVDEIYHVGLYQNLFEYYSYVGDKQSAEKYYRMALENAKRNYWKGKEKKLENLKQVFE